MNVLTPTQHSKLPFSQVASAHNSLANLQRAAGEYEKAEPHYLKALHIMETLLGLEAPSLSTPMFNLAELLHSQGKYEEAEPLFRRYLRLTTEVINLRFVISPLPCAKGRPQGHSLLAFDLVLWSGVDWLGH